MKPISPRTDDEGATVHDLASYVAALEPAGWTVLVFDARGCLVASSPRARRLLDHPKRFAPLLVDGAASSPSDPAERATRAWRLTKAQAAVLRFVLEGLANKEIAQRLGISARTVEAHLTTMFDKASVDSRTRLIVAASRFANEP